MPRKLYDEHGALRPDHQLDPATAEEVARRNLCAECTRKELAERLAAATDPGPEADVDLPSDREAPRC